MAGLVIAVDGPSGSGKSSTARGVATRLGLRYLDTGAMYRALTWALLERQVDVENAAAVVATAPGIVIEPGTDPLAPTITADGVDVSIPIRGPAVTAAVSAVSAVPQVRQLLVRLQRRIIGDGGIAVEGRDIGSVVAPDAAVKVFLVADPVARAARRAAEQGHSSADVPLTQQDMARRDELDSSRQASPLTCAPDAVVIDTTDLTLADTVEQVVALAQPAAKAATP